MKNTFKNLFVSLVTFSSFGFAVSPVDIGHWRGSVYSSPTLRQPFELEGGSLVKCQADAASSLDLSRCELENASLVISGNEWNGLKVTFTNASVLRIISKSPAWTYYLRGTADVLVGDQTVATPVFVALNREDAKPNRVRGLIEFPEQATKTTLEAYLVP